jgi:hypothetical protein
MENNSKSAEDIRTIRKMMEESTRFLSLSGLSGIFALYFSFQKSKKERKEFWSPASRRLLINLLIPLITGGIFAMVLLIQNHIQLIVPGLLIFYGLGLVNAGKFTYNEVFYLGILEIFTGLLSAFFIGWGLIFWIFGFGILHIVYGVVMYRKYEA